MKIIDTENLDHRAVNEAIRKADRECILKGCCGQRFIAAGMSDIHLTINGQAGKCSGRIFKQRADHRKR